METAWYYSRAVLFLWSGNLTKFSLLIALGTVLGLIWVVYETPPRARQTSLNAGLLVLFSALIGARAAYVAVHWEYFQVNLDQALQIWSSSNLAADLADRLHAITVEIAESARLP